MRIAWDVIALYVALGIWAGLLVQAVRIGSYRRFLTFGLVIAVVLNVRYFLDGPGGSIAYFIGIYDVFDNIGLGRTEGAPALAQCADNACTVWGDRYVNHPSWGVAFHDRFVNGTSLRTGLLYAHIAFNTVAFILTHVQLYRPGTGPNRARHRLLGRISFLSLTLGTIGAVWLASEHGDVSEYGGLLAELGFYSMSVFVYGSAVMGVLTIRKGSHAAHRVWMIRMAGAMWGSFWLFRVMLVVTGPLFRGQESVSLLLSIWLSAPLGILIAEVVRVRSERRQPSVSGTSPLPASATN